MRMNERSFSGATPATLSCDGLTKSFDGLVAVDDLSFVVPPGQVTGFVGANGSGKTTTLRTVVGLCRPDRGRALIGGREYRDLPSPRSAVGVAFDEPRAHPAYTGRAYLSILATTAGLPAERIDIVLDEVELTGAAGRRVGEYSLGMRQRLSLAAALIGEPPLLLLDEPANGLDPSGIRWLRDLLRRHADRGGAVLVSSHVLTELEQVIDRIVVIDRGRLVIECSLPELLSRSGGGEHGTLEAAYHLVIEDHRAQREAAR